MIKDNRAELNESGTVSVLALVNVVLRGRRTVLVATVVTALVLLASRLALPPLYAANTTFLTQGTDAAGLGPLAQLGRATPQASSNWSPSLYVDVLSSRALLQPVALDTIVVAEEGNRRVPLPELLEVAGGSANAAAQRAVGALRRLLTIDTNGSLGEVQITVLTKWPSVSAAIARRLLAGVNDFNVQTRRSQATAERQFVESRATQAEVELRAAEDRLQEFLQRNRVLSGSPDLTFQQQRLQRDITVRQEIYMALLQSLETARANAIRDTPVITVLEPPYVPTRPQSRGILVYTILGAIMGAILGVMLVFLRHGFSRVRQGESPEAREFATHIRDFTPRALRDAWARRSLGPNNVR